MFDLHDLFFLCFKTRAKLGLCAVQAKRFIVLHERPSATTVNVTQFFIAIGNVRRVIAPSAIAVTVIQSLH